GIRAGEGRGNGDRWQRTVVRGDRQRRAGRRERRDGVPGSGTVLVIVAQVVSYRGNTAAATPHGKPEASDKGHNSEHVSLSGAKNAPQLGQREKKMQR